jgi:hypothetical protein
MIATALDNDRAAAGASEGAGFMNSAAFPEEA